MEPIKLQYIDEKPRLTAKFQVDGGTARYLTLLIDSGADYTLISHISALLLGVDYHSLDVPEIDLETANLEIMKAKKIHLTITIEGQNLTIPVLISNQYIENLLGRNGVFKHFDILFQESRQKVIFSQPS